MNPAGAETAGGDGVGGGMGGGGGAEQAFSNAGTAGARMGGHCMGGGGCLGSRGVQLKKGGLWIEVGRCLSSLRQSLYPREALPMPRKNHDEVFFILSSGKTNWQRAEARCQ
jgi:hypothetical protein